MRQPKGSGHTTPLRTHTQITGHTINRKKSVGDQGWQQPPVLLDGRRHAPVENSRKMRQPTKCDLQRRRSAPPGKQHPRPASRRPRSTAGSDGGAAPGAEPPPRRQHGGAAQWHRPCCSAAPAAAGAPSSFPKLKFPWEIIFRMTRVVKVSAGHYSRSCTTGTTVLVSRSRSSTYYPDSSSTIIERGEYTELPMSTTEPQ